MGWIAWILAPTLLSPGISQDSDTFSGTKDQAQMILGLFGLVILFGAVGTANALYMITTGRQSRVFVIITLLLAAVLIGVAWVTTRMLK
jgi:hypothetical protein